MGSLLGCGGGSVAGSSTASSSTTSSTKSSAGSTSSSANFQTWWHTNYEENAASAVADNKVRRSTIYDVNVIDAANQTSNDKSFVYMTLPRGGKVKNYTGDDGAEFATSAHETMSWSSFLYKTDVWVEVKVKDGKTIASVDEVLIRPTTLHFDKQLVNSTTVRIKVPYNDKGYRFSVELQSELMTIRSTQLGNSGALTEAPNNAVVHVQPRNSLLVFAEPMLTQDQQAELVPTETSGSIYYPKEGAVTLNNLTQKIVYFKPGVYSMSANYHARLSSSVQWVYLAPGAYVKGAIEFAGSKSDYKLTGFGVLSGEKYVYAPDKTNNYSHSLGNCDGTCLRLLQFSASGLPQTLTVHGITINEVPFNSFSVSGGSDSYKTQVSNYKQVGSWYWQTDGVESYGGGYLKNAFFHANDDVLKMYHSNITAENIVIWKGENGPAIQFGWASRNMSNILVKDVDVIHNRMYWKDQKSNICIINSTNMYSETPLDYDKISTSHTIKNMEFRNIRSEGKNLCAMRFVVLSNWESIHINGLEIEEWNDLLTDSQVSTFSARKTMEESPQPLSIGLGDLGLKIENYKVAGQLIQRTDESWKLTSNGRINFDPELVNNWTAVGTGAHCIAQSIDFPQPSAIAINSSAILTATASSGLPVSFNIVGGEGSIVGSSLTTGAMAAQLAVAAQAGDDTHCKTKIVRLLNVVDVNSAPIDGRWIGASWASWSPATIPMTWDANEKLYKATVNLPAGTQQMKFTNTTNWSGDDWAGVNGFSGTAIKTTGGGDNISFNVINAGSYLVKFNPYTLVYSITLI